jgi:hypothetical protein
MLHGTVWIQEKYETISRDDSVGWLLMALSGSLRPSPCKLIVFRHGESLIGEADPSFKGLAIGCCLIAR